MTPKEASDALKKRIKDLERFRVEIVPDIIGNEAVRHYNESFTNEGATDKSFKKWDEVERRKPDSPWYGFSLGSNSQKPVETDETGKNIIKTSKAKATNFSPTRAQDKILTGDTNDLKNATHYVKKSDRVTIRNDKPYARVHNFGEQSYIFGRKAFNQKARPFIYPSAVLNKAIYDKVAREMKRQGLIK
jgi:phage gpG-like protein